MLCPHTTIENVGRGILFSGLNITNGYRYHICEGGIN